MADRPTAENFMTQSRIFAAAIAVAALFALVTTPRAQDSKKAKAETNATKGSDDTRRVREIAQADMAEVAAGKLGAGKASSDEVKQFAQHMVEDHGKHLNDLRSLAKTKGMQLPTAPARKQQEAMKKLEGSAGADFDRHFMTQMVKDHQQALRLVQNTAKHAKDADLKADAEKTAPRIQQHLEMAKKIAASLKS
jgi:putative membrane protein